MNTCIDKIYEIRDSMMESIETSDKIVSEQEALAEVIKNSEFKDKLQDYVKELEANKDKYNENKVILTKRIDLLNEVIKSYEEDKLMEDVLELDIEDLVVNEDGYEITTTPNNFLAVKEGLERLGYTNFIMSEVTYIPDNYMSLDEEASEKAMALIEALEDLDDVQAVYHNLEL